MIIVSLTGGLGNQLFQYAAARSLAAHHKTDMYLDLSFYTPSDLLLNTTPREYKLGYFNTINSFPSDEDVVHLSLNPFTNTPKGFLYRVLRKLHLYQSSLVWERDFTRFDRSFFSTPCDAYLRGYWANEKYFYSIEDVIRKEFTPKFVPNEKSIQIAEKMSETTSVSIHVRRGDYVTSSSAKTLFYALSSEYYVNAINYLTRRLSSIHIFVFSDDPIWVKTNLKFDFPATYISHNGIERDYEDLWLMSQCKYHIIANSTFSWWGAWLSLFPDKIVIAPKAWYSPQTRLTLELPSSWIKM